MRICIVYDCLYPYTIGGAERWCRNLAERLAADGNEVTYLTLRQWPRGERPALDGVEVVEAGPRMELYEDGRRRVAPPLLFGLGVLGFLLRQGRRFDVVHSVAFPYFSLLAAGLARRRHRFRLFVDWFEVWTRNYWREYLGRGGDVGWLIQQRCARLPQHAFCFSRLHERRLREEGLRGQPQLLGGVFAGTQKASTPSAAEPLVVFAGRHIPEKRVLALPPAIARVRQDLPELGAQIFGDGPERPKLLEAIRAIGLDAAVEAPGFVNEEKVQRVLRRALCLVLPSRREGYGLVIVEAASLGVPSIVVASPDNAATELITEGENGFVASSAEPDDLAAAILRVHDSGHALREATAAWFDRNARRLSLESSLEAVLEAYRS